MFIRYAIAGYKRAMRPEFIGHIHRAPNLVTGHEVPDMNIAELHNFKAVQHIRQARNGNINTTHRALEPLLCIAVQGCDQRNRTGNGSGVTEERSPRQVYIRTTRAGRFPSRLNNRHPDPLQCMDQLNQQEGTKRREQPEMRRRNHPEPRPLMRNEVPENPVCQHYNQPCCCYPQQNTEEKVPPRRTDPLNGTPPGAKPENLSREQQSEHRNEE